MPVKKKAVVKNPTVKSLERKRKKILEDLRQKISKIGFEEVPLPPIQPERPSIEIRRFVRYYNETYKSRCYSYDIYLNNELYSNNQIVSSIYGEEKDKPEFSKRTYLLAGGLIGFTLAGLAVLILLGFGY